MASRTFYVFQSEHPNGQAQSHPQHFPPSKPSPCDLAPVQTLGVPAEASPLRLGAILLLPEAAEGHGLCLNNNELPSGVNKATGMKNK